MTGRGDARLPAIGVTANMIDMWGVAMVAGRRFAAGEDAPGDPQSSSSAIVSGSGSQPRSVDPRQSLTLNGQPHTVVGVMSSAMEFGNLDRRSTSGRPSCWIHRSRAIEGAANQRAARS